jgi:hypothetical protein
MHNSYARARLSATSDHDRYLVWRGQKADPASVGCSQNLARNASADGRPRGPID